MLGGGLNKHPPLGGLQWFMSGFVGVLKAWSCFCQWRWGSGNVSKNLHDDDCVEFLSHLHHLRICVLMLVADYTCTDLCHEYHLFGHQKVESWKSLAIQAGCFFHA